MSVHCCTRTRCGVQSDVAAIAVGLSVGGSTRNFHPHATLGAQPPLNRQVDASLHFGVCGALSPTHTRVVQVQHRIFGHLIPFAKSGIWLCIAELSLFASASALSHEFSFPCRYLEIALSSHRQDPPERSGQRRRVCQQFCCATKSTRRPSSRILRSGKQYHRFLDLLYQYITSSQR